MVVCSIFYMVYSNAVSLRRDLSIMFSRVSITMLSSGFILGVVVGFLLLFNGVGLCGGFLLSSCNTQVFQTFVICISGLILQLTGFYPRKLWIKEYARLLKILFWSFVYFNTKILNKLSKQFKIIEYPLILLFINVGAGFLMSSGDMISLFLALELQSYGLYILCTLYRDSELATSGGLTYFLLGGLSSCFVLLATTLLYSNSGSTSLDALYVVGNVSEEDNIKVFEDVIYWYKPYYIHYSLLIMSVGFLFKVSAAPFHFWAPDVYDAIPTIVTTFVAIVAKISIFVFLLELVHFIGNSFFNLQFTWTFSLLLSSLLSLIIGTVLGLSQFRIKRLYAYSTISHVGFILLALSIHSIESVQAFIFYLMQYSLSNLNAFFLLIGIGYSLYYYVNKGNQEHKLLEVKNSPIQLVNQLKGYFKINPVIALSLSITIFSFVGIPPLIGFFAKQMVLSAALDSGYIFLALVAIITSVIGAVYYLGVIKQMFFDKVEYVFNVYMENKNLVGSLYKGVNFVETVTFKVQDVVLSSYMTITTSILTLGTLLFIFVPQEWLRMANILALTIFNP